MAFPLHKRGTHLPTYLQTGLALRKAAHESVCFIRRAISLSCEKCALSFASKFAQAELDHLRSQGNEFKNDPNLDSRELKSALKIAEVERDKARQQLQRSACYPTTSFSPIKACPSPVAPVESFKRHLLLQIPS